MPVRISAAICTHNRAAYLPDAIESLFRQTLPSSEYEILVIDNCSSDQTACVLQDYAAKSGGMNLRSAGTEKPGVSRARNLVIQMAEGEIISFLDDDAIASPHWLAALLEVYHDFPDAWAVGGRVLPLWEDERPEWLSDDLLPQLSMLDLGNATRPLAAGEELFGVNCSFRRIVFDRLGLFRLDLGRYADHLLGSEETEIQQRIRNHGKALLYTPRAVVHHRVMPERMQTSYFIQLAKGKGRTRARLMLADSDRRENITWRVLRGGLAVVRHWLQQAFHPGDKRRRLKFRRVAAHWSGFLREVLTTKADRKP